VGKWEQIERAHFSFMFSGHPGGGKEPFTAKIHTHQLETKDISSQPFNTSNPLCMCLAPPNAPTPPLPELLDTNNIILHA
jgi:hypothetical protein